MDASWHSRPVCEWEPQLKQETPAFVSGAARIAAGYGAVSDGGGNFDITTGCVCAVDTFTRAGDTLARGELLVWYFCECCNDKAVGCMYAMVDGNGYKTSPFGCM